MTPKRQTTNFALRDVLSVTTGVWMSRATTMKPLREILEFMSDDHVDMTDAIRTAEEMVPRIFAQHPQLKGMVPPDDSVDALMAWVADREREFGETIALYPDPQFHAVPAVRFLTIG